MLKEFRVKNLRSLKDTGVVRLSPITILLGENSSGKSTFLRAFPLLKQSAETTTRSSILWFGKYVDYGDFDQALIREKGAKEIVFSFGLTVPDQIYHTPLRLHRPSSRDKDRATSNVTVDLRLASLGKDGLTRTAGLDINIDGNRIRVNINEQNKTSSIVVNEIDYSEYSDSFIYNSAIRILPLIQARREDSKDDVYRPWWHNFMPDKVNEALVLHLKKYVHGKTGDDTIAMALLRAPVGDADVMLAGFKRLFNTATWRSKTGNMNGEHEGFLKYKNLLLLGKMGLCIYNIDEVLDTTFRRISYVEPIRASAQRYYRSQDIGVKELDSKGENLAMFLRNLSDRERTSLDDWSMEEFGFKVVVTFNGGHVNLGVAFKGANESYNLADMGFGFSQVIPIIVQLWTILNKSGRAAAKNISNTCVIEQPELHLHPRMQAKLAEILVSVVNAAKKSGIILHLIIETHSEVIINKIGLMTGAGILKKEDSTIVLFSKKNESSQTKVELSGYNDKGVLQNWPFGFFDFEV